MDCFISMFFSYIRVFPKIVVPQNGWFMMEKPIKMDDLGVPLFSETPIYYPESGPQKRLLQFVVFRPLDPEAFDSFGIQAQKPASRGIIASYSIQLMNHEWLILTLLVLLLLLLLL